MGSLKVITIGAVFSAALIGIVQAHSGATGIVKERMDLMSSIGDAMKGLTAMMRGKTDYDAEQVKILAKRIQGHSGEAMTKLFPEDSLDKPTEATPAIWEDWTRFQELADQLSIYSGALAEAAGNDRGEPGQSGMMGGDMMHGDMMRDDSMGHSMIDEHGTGPSADHLATMPPDASFMHLARTCSACHEAFREKRMNH